MTRGRTMTISHDGHDYTGEITRIKSTHLGEEDHGIFTAYLELENVMVGGYALTEWDESLGRRVGSGYGIEHITRMMEVAGARRWEDLPGRMVIALYEDTNYIGSRCVGIAGLDNDEVMILDEHSAEWAARQSQAV